MDDTIRLPFLPFAVWPLTVLDLHFLVISRFCSQEESLPDLSLSLRVI